MKGFLFTILFIFLFVSSAFSSAMLVVDEKPGPVIDGTYKCNGIEYVQIIPVLKALGFKTTWNETANKLIFKGEAGTGVLSPLSPFITFGAGVFHLPGPPVFLDAKLCVPVEFVSGDLSEILSRKISFNNWESCPAPPPMGLPHRPLYLRKIVIDPGHGGHDPGATSPSGLKEKDIVLLVALKLADRLRDEMGIEVVMTRSDDTFITLGERARITNTSGAQIFISIHANGAFNNTATGTETFFLSFEASDQKAAALAAAENASLRLETDNPMADSDIDDLKTILWDLVRTEVLKDSEKLAIVVQTRLEKQLNLPSRGVKQAPFYVLMGSSIPAILVEIGFMTTVDEASLLADSKFQDRIVYSLFSAILNYDTVRAMEIHK